MTSTFEPRFDTLPPAQRALWPGLAKAAALDMVLYGGTAVALRLGHRSSVDFDFFGDQALDRDAIRRLMPFMAGATSLQDQGHTWTVLVSTPSGSVKVSFFGAIGFGRVGEPEITQDGVLQVASIGDLMATKLKVILQRAEAKDYRDIAAMLDAGASLAHGLAAARTMFGPNFQPSESLKALVYHGDGDLASLDDGIKRTLIAAASRVGDLPDVTIVSRRLIAG
jgi:hypothetical protein